MENSTPVQRPGSLIEKEEKGDQIEEKDMVDQEEVGSHLSPTTFVSYRLDISDRGLESESPQKRQRRQRLFEIVFGQRRRLFGLFELVFELERLERLEIFERLEKKTHNSHAARMQEMKLLKCYGFLKEELNWPDIISIADSLYIDGHLNWHEWQNIRDRSQPRRKAIDTLLGVVLGNASSVSAFMKIMESKSTLSYIAERINMTQLSAEEMERFDHLEGIPQGQRPSIYQEPSQKFHLSDSDVGFLICHFYKKEEVIDQISDLMLSNFLISTHDHTRIFEQAHTDGKILELTDLIKTCPDGVYDIFIEVLRRSNMEYVLERLERNRMPNMKRKYLSFDLDNPPVQKRMRINHNQKGSASDALEKIASGLRISTIRQKLGNEARKHLDLEFKESFWGSSGLMFSFQVREPSQKLFGSEVGEPPQKLKQLVA